MRDVHDAVVMLQDDAALLHLGEDKFLERLQSYVDLAPALREQVRDIDYVDLAVRRSGVRAAGGGEEVSHRGTGGFRLQAEGGICGS